MYDVECLVSMSSELAECNALLVGAVSHGAPGFRLGCAEFYGTCGDVASACCEIDAVACVEGVGSLEELSVGFDGLGPPYHDDMFCLEWL